MQNKWQTFESKIHQILVPEIERLGFHIARQHIEDSMSIMLSSVNPPNSYITLDCLDWYVFESDGSKSCLMFRFSVVSWHYHIYLSEFNSQNEDDVIRRQGWIFYTVDEFEILLKSVVELMKKELPQWLKKPYHLTDVTVNPEPDERLQAQKYRLMAVERELVEAKNKADPDTINELLEEIEELKQLIAKSEY